MRLSERRDVMKMFSIEGKGQIQMTGIKSAQHNGLPLITTGINWFLKPLPSNQPLSLASGSVAPVA